MLPSMDITGYVERLRADLRTAGAAGGDAVAEAAERLAGALDAAVHVTLLEVLSDAAAEITAGLEGATVELRLRGRQPELVVSVDAAPAEATSAGSEGAGETDDVDGPAAARITLRIAEPLKQRAEVAAAAARQSLNTWIVEAVRAATDQEPPPRRQRSRGQHLSGWAH